jgi:hypothetical protein
MLQNELAQPPFHIGPDLAPHPHIEHQPRVVRRQPAKFGGRQIGFAQEAFDETVDMHKRLLWLAAEPEKTFPNR